MHHIFRQTVDLFDFCFADFSFLGGDLQELYLMIKETSMPKEEFVFGSVSIECTRGVPFSLIIYIHQWK